MKKVASLVLACVVVLAGCPGVGSIMRKFGYTEVRPPSTLLAPGTIVWVKRAAPFSAGIICTQRSSLGEGFKPLQAPTAHTQVAQEVEADFSVEPGVINEIVADASFKYINNITAKLSHTRLHSVSDVDILNNLDGRDPACTQAIAARRQAGYQVTMIASAIMADVTFNVEYKTGIRLDKEAKISLLASLAPRLGLSEAHISASSVSGEGLYWGIIDDAYLGSLGTGMLAAPPATRNIPVDVIPILSFEPDVE